MIANADAVSGWSRGRIDDIHLIEQRAEGAEVGCCERLMIRRDENSPFIMVRLAADAKSTRSRRPHRD